MVASCEPRRETEADSREADGEGADGKEAARSTTAHSPSHAPSSSLAAFRAAMRLRDAHASATARLAATTVRARPAQEAARVLIELDRESRRALVTLRRRLRRRRATPRLEHTPPRLEHTPFLLEHTPPRLEHTPAASCALYAAHGCRHLPSRRATSRFFAATPPSGKRPRGADEGAAHPPDATPPAAMAWRAPRSPYGLLEEVLWHRPWALLLGCILLNQTSRAQVDPVLARLLARFPDAAHLAGASSEAAAMGEVEHILRPLGLQRLRAARVVCFSQEFLRGAWTKPEELPGVGKYGADAYRIFCCGEWKTTRPSDHALQWYCEWLQSTEED
ncbi:hypothetical protein AB1Y20_000252 [Prymnesium parvum]|uniref:Methyl-CpG-binding domain protein 4 n=1 Tax=Prymnesium parvum TaxID=97485 RepID=A0AB34K7N2_PRYPA